MKKKGFTLVELLAVIAILAILVIVAMPNVLGMFNQAKSNTFVTEVQKYMDTAKTDFMTQALSKPAQDIIFDSEDTAAAHLDMDGTKKYYISMNRNGEFTRVLIYDDNFCYDNTTEGLEKTDVVVTAVKESNSQDNKTNGCKGELLKAE